MNLKNWLIYISFPIMVTGVFYFALLMGGSEYVKASQSVLEFLKGLEQWHWILLILIIITFIIFAIMKTMEE